MPCDARPRALAPTGASRPPGPGTGPAGASDRRDGRGAARPLGRLLWSAKAWLVGGERVAEESLFDQAWDQWRRTLTDALGSADLSAHTRQVLAETAAFDPADGLIDRTWALELLAEGEPAARLRAHGLSEAEVAAMVDLIRRHPTPAAGG